jgi:Arc/MetJ-type ribon-helix-helix transcriptional regulator
MSLAIDLSEDAREWAEARVRSGEYATLSAYLAELVRRDRDVDLETAVAAGEESGLSDLSFEQVLAGARRELEPGPG